MGGVPSSSHSGIIYYIATKVFSCKKNHTISLIIIKLFYILFFYFFLSIIFIFVVLNLFWFPCYNFM